MKIRGIGRNKPILTALKKAGFKAVEIAEHGKKTVITISPCETKRGGKSVINTVFK